MQDLRITTETVSLTLDASLVERARSLGELVAVVEAALRRHLHDTIDERRWAEENALAVEALAGGAEEIKP